MITSDTLADSIKSIIDSAPDSTWSDLSIGDAVDDDFKVMTALDPLTAGINNPGVFVVPVGPLYSIEKSKGRGQIYQLGKDIAMMLIISIPIAGTSSGETQGIDVSSWTEVGRVLKVREELESLVLTASITDAHIIGIETEPPQEIELKDKWFMTFTEIMYEVKAC